LKRFLHVYLKTLLTHTNGNQSLAAKISGLQRSYVNKIVNELNLGTAGSRPEGFE
jgi:DNA-binding protein Fis